jgi:hypothetical protein
MLKARRIRRRRGIIIIIIITRFEKPPKGFPQNLAYILRRVGRIF